MEARSVVRAGLDVPEWVRPATERGHLMAEDDTFTGLPRWTCARCGRAVIRNGSTVYGSAKENDCG